MSALEPLEEVIEEFKQILTPDERANLSTSPADSRPDGSAVIAFTASLDRANASRKGQSIATCLYSLIQSVQQFSEIVETFVSSNPTIAALVWGSVKLAFMIVANFTSYFEAFTSILVGIEKTRPRFEEYRALFPDSTGLQKALCEFYASIIRCCTRLITITRRGWAATLFRSVLSSLESELQPSTDAIKEAVQDVKDEISLAKAREDNEEHKKQRLEREATKEQRSQFAGFLSRNGSNKELMDASEWRRQVAQRRLLKRNAELLEGLSTYDHITAFQQARRKRFNGTGDWIFSTTSFTGWKTKDKSGTLCLSGKIGSGKTILSAAVVSRLFEQESPSSAVMFHFVRFDDANSMHPETILKSLIRQNLEPESLSEEMTACLSTAAKSLYSLDSLKVLLERKLMACPSAFIVIDALDECPPADRRILMEVFSAIMVLPSVRLKLFVSTRGSGLFQIRQQHSANIYDISTHAKEAERDIEVYIRDVIGMKVSDGDLTVQDPEIIGEISEALSKGAQGMFLWVALEIEDVCSQCNDEAIRSVLQDLPKDLTETFDRALRRISARHRNQENVARDALHAVAAAKRPLKLDELRLAISIEIGQAYWRPVQLINGIDRVARWCENLLYIDDSTDTVQFIHHSALQYILEPSNVPDISHFHKTLKDCDHWLGEICVTFLDLNDFKTSLVKRMKPMPLLEPTIISKVALKSSSWTSKTVERIATIIDGSTSPKIRSEHTESTARLEKYRTHAITVTGTPVTQEADLGTLLNYALAFWIHHTSFFEVGKSATWKTWEVMISGSHNLATTPWTDDEYTRKNEAIVLWADEEGHSALLGELFLAGTYPLGYNNAKVMALFITRDHETLLQRLVSSQPHEELLNNYGRALARGSIFQPRRLIEEANCDCHRSLHDLQGDLCYSVRQGSIRPVLHGPTFVDLVFLAAAWYGARPTLLTLLNHGRVWYESRTSTGKTALHLSAEAGHLGITKILLDEGWDITATTKRGKTPLHLALDRSHGNVVLAVMEAQKNMKYVPNPRKRKPVKTSLDLAAEQEKMLDLAEILSGTKTPRVRQNEKHPAAMPHIMRANGLTEVAKLHPTSLS